MKRNIIYMIIIFTVVWIVLMEELTLWSVGAGLAVSTLCAVFCRIFLPLDRIAGVNYFWFFVYVIYLIGQVYVAAISAVKLVIKGAKSDIVVVDTAITNDFLRVMLANSITLVPGSVTLDMNDDKITILMLSEKDGGPQELKSATDRIKDVLEKRLIKAQK